MPFPFGSAMPITGDTTIGGFVSGDPSGCFRLCVFGAEPKNPGPAAARAVHHVFERNYRLMFINVTPLEN